MRFTALSVRRSFSTDPSGSTLTPAQTELLTPEKVTASVSDIETALAQATVTGRLPVERLNSAVMHIVGAEHVDLCRTGQ